MNAARQPERPEPGFPATVIYTPGATLNRMVLAELRALKDPGCLLRTAPHIADAVPFSVAPKIGVMGPAMGTPAATIACGMILREGTARVVLVGVAGALHQPGVTDPPAFGDVLVPRGRARDGSDRVLPESPGEYQSRLESIIEAEGLRMTAAPLWTTDSPQREPSAAVTRMIDLGCRGVEMEYDAVASCCATAPADCAAAFVVSDILAGTWDPGFKRREVTSSLQKLVRAAVSLCL